MAKTTKDCEKNSVPLMEYLRSRPTSETLAYAVRVSFWENKMMDVNTTIEMILSLKEPEIAEIINHYSKKKDRDKDTKKLKEIQNTLKGYGLTKKDGPFMEIGTLLISSKQELIEELVTYKAFSKEDAETAVALGIRAEWFSFE
ncbi:MAG: hypothetical protein JWL92_453 [Candidatus Nomurabacteria bacterium]|nr:hypothetical protein [Candidatus Nomurabacteria bacterium]